MPYKLSDYYAYIVVAVLGLLAVWGMTGMSPLTTGGGPKKGVLVFYYVDWCGFCTKAKPEWEKLEKENAAAAELMKVHCEEQAEMAAKAGIQGYPTFIYYPAGMHNPGYTFNGEAKATELKKFVDEKAPMDTEPDAAPVA